MAEAPKIPTPDKIMELTNKHIAQTIEVINAQMAEASSVLGAPTPPALPKFAPPSLPKMGGSSSPPFPQLPFFAPAEKKGEERVTPPTVPITAKEIVA